MTSLSRLSKLLALFLRHRPEEAGLQIDTYGFVPLDEMLKAIQERYPEVVEGDIRKLIEGASQQRFEISDRGIRAVYGHSFFVEMDGEPIQAPEVLYMGCLRKEVERFRTDGIKPVDRYYVHLSMSRETAAERSHQPGDACVIEVAAAQAQAAGHQFYQRGEVVLTLEIPAQFVGEAHDVALPPGARRPAEESDRRGGSRGDRRPSGGGDRRSSGGGGERRPPSGNTARPPSGNTARPAASTEAAAPAFGRRPRKATGRR
ncbi:MAG: RNA 2'-phosphotransferase [Candidatus Latescibacteria bacterium]|nr:RNA 2'-phosphotransferase [Candidatus Latescibacterota bacterium]